MGFTWNYAATGAPNKWFRGVSSAGAIALLTTTVAVSGVSVALHRTLFGVPVGVGASPWFGEPAALPGAVLPLPDLSSVEQVIQTGKAWNQGATGAGIDVALLDSGVTPVQGLDAPNKVVYGPDLSFDSQDPNKAYLDGYGHGTAMASLIAGNDGLLGAGFMGVAPSARIVSVKVGASNGAVDVSQMIAGIDWVVQHRNDPGLNIRVLNISLGTDSVQSYLRDPLAHAAEVAWRAGIVVVASVGNGGPNAALADPAIDPYLLAVGAEDPNGSVSSNDDLPAPFTSRGTGDRHADVVAPGVYILGLRVPGSTLDQQYPAARIGTRYFRGSGTSHAAALVSGAVADMLSVRPWLKPDDVKRLLTKTATGISGSSSDIGSGLINVAAASQAGAINNSTQTFAQSVGDGTLEGARGTSHVAIGNAVLSGEQDIFGKPWQPAMAAAEEAGATWSGGSYNGATWSGATWSGATWSGATWSGATWSGATWSGATWSGSTWSGSTWSAGEWS